MSGRSLTEILGHGYKSMSYKRLANNTVEITDPDGTRRIRLHRTDILTFRPDGSIVVDTGGWDTQTTRDRLNTYGYPYLSVSTCKGKTTLHVKGRGSVSLRGRTVVPPRDCENPEAYDAPFVRMLMEEATDPDRAAWYGNVLLGKTPNDLEVLLAVTAVHERAAHV